MQSYSEEEFLNKVLSIGSVNGSDDERILAEFLANYLKACGVNAVVQEIGKKHANVIAMLEGKSEEKIIWNGHLDTVPYGKISEWSTDPAVPVKKNGCIYARGASDMKSGLAGMVYTLGNMKKRGYVPRQTIYFFGTCDEEKGGNGAEQILRDGRMDDAILLLIGEPTGLKIGSAQKGCVWMEMQVRGRTSHGAYPNEGVNAIEYGMQIFSDIKSALETKSHSLLGKPTVQLTGISGGIAPNMTPDEADIRMDIRIIPGMTEKDVLYCAEEAKEKYVRQTKGVLTAKFRIENKRRAIETSEDDFWIRKIQWGLRCMKIPDEKIGIPFFTDASILTRNDTTIPVILFGPGEPHLAHKPDEYVEVKQYIRYIQLLNQIF